ncbi:MAG: hypothetical protein NC820_06440 [Candidatus Omnitrophica bacterium]|nr:hypothetical protein [Candidatus Omnitrophota bacterium]
MTKLTTQERLERLILNHKEHFWTITMNFVNQAHQLMKEIENPNDYQAEAKRWKDECERLNKLLRSGK